MKVVESVVVMIFVSVLIVGAVVLWMGVGSGLIEVSRVLR